MSNKQYPDSPSGFSGVWQNGLLVYFMGGISVLASSFFAAPFIIVAELFGYAPSYPLCWTISALIFAPYITGSIVRPLSSLDQ